MQKSAVPIIFFAVLVSGCATIHPPKPSPQAEKPSVIMPAPARSPASVVPKQVYPLSFEDIEKKAEALAASPYQEPKAVPKFLTDISYDQWRDIRFDPRKALWENEGLSFRVQFFHPGYLYRNSVHVNIVSPSAVKEVPFSRDFFTYGQNHFSETFPDDLGFAGFRLHYPLNHDGVFDEVIVFLGASYFRAVAEGQHYGLSARGLAVNAALSRGEEFPMFREFWIVEPEPSDKEITIYALLDGPSVAGAYRFVVKPGKETVVDIKARVWARQDIDKLGIAPTTSMFFYGEHSLLEAKVRDFRPEVHDSDGLFLALGNGDNVWRPLMNPQRLLINDFHAIDLERYGLLQRDSVFDHYQDLEARYEKRPSLWIEPARDKNTADVWKEGAVELIQIPTQNEYNDNVVASWVPASKFLKGTTMDFAYTMRWASAIAEMPLAAVQTTLSATPVDKQKRTFMIDFRGPTLDGFTEEAPPEAEISLTGGHAHVAQKQVVKNEPAGAWRLVFEIEEDRSAITQVLPMPDVVEIRANLKKGSAKLSETWSYAAEF